MSFRCMVTCLLAACAQANEIGASRHRLGLCQPYRAWSRGQSKANRYGYKCFTRKAFLPLVYRITADARSGHHRENVHSRALVEVLVIRSLLSYGVSS